MPAATGMLEQVGVQSCVLVDSEAQLVADRHGEVDVSHDVGGEVQAVDEPTRPEQTDCGLASRKRRKGHRGDGFPRW